MRVAVGQDQKVVPGDLLVRVVLRSDLAPVPMTAEVTFRNDPRIRGDVGEGKVISVGRDGVRFTIVKDGHDNTSGQIQGPSVVSTLPKTALLESCAAIASPLRRAVIKEGANLGDIYRACGAKVSIASDFAVSRFSCFVGGLPSEQIAVALQEEGAVLCARKDGLTFLRINRLMDQTPVRQLQSLSSSEEASGFLEKMQVPWAFSVGDDGSILMGKNDSGRVARYWPRATQRVLNNLSSTVVRRRSIDAEFSPDLGGGDVLLIRGKPQLIITAAHVWENDPTFGAKQYSRLWLGEVVK